MKWHQQNWSPLFDVTVIHSAGQISLLYDISLNPITHVTSNWSYQLCLCNLIDYAWFDFGNHTDNKQH